MKTYIYIYIPYIYIYIYTPNQTKSCKLPFRIHPAAPTVLQGRPEVQKWLPKVLSRLQNNHSRCFRSAKIVSQGAPEVQK